MINVKKLIVHHERIVHDLIRARNLHVLSLSTNLPQTLMTCIFGEKWLTTTLILLLNAICCWALSSFLPSGGVPTWVMVAKRNKRTLHLRSLVIAMKRDKEWSEHQRVWIWRALLTVLQRERGGVRSSRCTAWRMRGGGYSGLFGDECPTKESSAVCSLSPNRPVVSNF